MSIEASVTFKRERILASGITIYDVIEPNAVGEYYYTDDELVHLFASKLKGVSFAGLPNRTRSKVAKSMACEILGFPVPKSFKKTRPRFFNQNFDLLVHKAHNVQPVNKDVLDNRRFILVKVDEEGLVKAVKLIHGLDLLAFDKTGTLTLKYQARVGKLLTPAELVSPLDTWATDGTLKLGKRQPLLKTSPLSNPSRATLLPIAEIFERLSGLVNTELSEIGRDQERNRGAGLHAAALKSLGYAMYADNGRHPDVPNQLLEIKLQTSPTIDLGSMDPASEELLPRITVDGQAMRHCDVRFAVFVGKLKAGTIKINHLVVVTGRDFSTKFKMFGGLGVNSKRQIHLPKDFFD